MNVAGDRQRHRQHMGAVVGVAGKQSGLGKGGLEPVDDCQALDQPPAVRFQHRHETLRVLRAIRLRLLLALEQVHRHRLIIDLFEVERDADPVAGRGAVIIVEDGLGHGARK
jgi:hypothetical protein